MRYLLIRIVTCSSIRSRKLFTLCSRGIIILWTCFLTVAMTLPSHSPIGDPVLPLLRGRFLLILGGGGGDLHHPLCRHIMDITIGVTVIVTVTVTVTVINRLRS